MTILCYRQLETIQNAEPSVKHILTIGFQSRGEEPCAVGEVRGVPQQAELPQSPGPSQMKEQNRKNPRALTLQLYRQLYPSLYSDGNGAPQEDVEDHAHQIQPPDHLYRRRAGDERTAASAGRCLDLSTQNWGTHRVAEQIDSEVRVIGP